MFFTSDHGQPLGVALSPMCSLLLPSVGLPSCETSAVVALGWRSRSPSPQKLTGGPAAALLSNSSLSRSGDTILAQQRRFVL